MRYYLLGILFILSIDCFSQLRRWNITNEVQQCTHNNVPVAFGGIPVDDCFVITDMLGRQTYVKRSMFLSGDLLYTAFTRVVNDLDTLYIDSVDLSSLGGGGGTDLHFAKDDLTATGNRVHDWVNFDFTIDNIDASSITANSMFLDASTTIRGAGITDVTKALIIENSTGADMLVVDDEAVTRVGATTYNRANLTTLWSPLVVGGGTFGFTLTNTTSQFNSRVGAAGSIMTLTGTQGFGNVAGLDFSVYNRNTNGGNIIRAGYFSPRNENSSSRANTLIGVVAQPVSSSSSGTITTFRGLEAVLSAGGAGTITNADGLFIWMSSNGGTMTNTYGLRIGEITLGTQTNTAYSILTEDPDAIISFAGDLFLPNEETLDNTIDSVLVRDNTNGEIKLRSISSIGGGADTHFANADLTATADRLHAWAGFDFTLNGFGQLTLDGANIEFSQTSGNDDINIFNGEIQLRSDGIIENITPALEIKNNAVVAEARWFESTSLGINYIAIDAPISVGSDYTYTLPAADGSNGDFMITDGLGNLSFTAAPSDIHIGNSNLTTTDLTRTLTLDNQFLFLSDINSNNSYQVNPEAGSYTIINENTGGVNQELLATAGDARISLVSDDGSGDLPDIFFNRDGGLSDQSTSRFLLGMRDNNEFELAKAVPGSSLLNPVFTVNATQDSLEIYYDIFLPNEDELDNTLDSILVLDNVTKEIKLRSASSISGGGSDTQFANTNLTATGNRLHDWDGNDLGIFGMSQLTLSGTDLDLSSPAGPSNITVGALIDLTSSGNVQLDGTNIFLEGSTYQFETTLPTLNNSVDSVLVVLASGGWRLRSLGNSIDLNSLTDVVISGSSNDDHLVYDGSNWTNQSVLPAGADNFAEVNLVFDADRFHNLDGNDFNLYNSTDTLHFESNGFLGIGTRVPKGELHVDGNAITEMLLEFDNSIGNYAEYQIIESGTDKWSFGMINSSAVLNPGSFYIYNYTTGSSSITILPSTGNVEINQDLVLPNEETLDNTIDSVLVRDNTTGEVKLRSASSLSGGSAPSFFQVEDDGTTTQLTTGTFTDVTGVWGTPSITDADFSFSSGVLTVNTAGTLELNISVNSWNNANNRHEMHVRIMADTGSGYVELVEAATYTSRNNTQDEGSVLIPGYKVSVNVGDDFKIQVLHIGSAASVGGTNVPGQTYISATLWP